MNILYAIIVGLVIGGLARLVLPGRQPIPLWLTCVIGIVGALIGNWLSVKLGVRHTNGIDWWRHAFQIGAAAVLISLVSPLYISRYRRTTAPY